MSNYTLIRTLQAEKYSPRGERFCSKCFVCKISAICTATIETNQTMIDEGLLLAEKIPSLNALFTISVSVFLVR